MDADGEWPAAPDELRRLYVEERWSLSRIGRLYGVSHPTVGDALARMGLKAPRPSRKALAGDRRKGGEPIGRDDRDNVKPDDGRYMAAVRRLNVAPPEELEFAPDRRPLPPRPTIGRAGCAAVRCTEA